MEHTAVVLVAHGTRDARGAETVRRLARRVAEALPTQEVALAYVDVQEPLVDEVLDDVMTRHASVVVVPLCSAAASMSMSTSPTPSPRTTGRGPWPRSVPTRCWRALMAERLRASNVAPGTHVVMAAAGSSRAVAAEDVETAADQLAPSGVGR